MNYEITNDGIENDSPSSAISDLIIENNLRNSIFVDVTANAEVVEVYPKLLQKAVSVIACNKIAASSDYKNYQKFERFGAVNITRIFYLKPTSARVCRLLIRSTI